MKIYIYIYMQIFLFRKLQIFFGSIGVTYIIYEDFIKMLKKNHRQKCVLMIYKLKFVHKNNQ